MPLTALEAKLLAECIDDARVRFMTEAATPDAAGGDVAPPLGARREVKSWSFAGSVGRFIKRISRSGGKGINSVAPNVNK